MILKSKIFRAYDIRGKAFIDFDEDGFFVIAAAFGRYISKKFSCKKPRIFVSGDGRLSMPELFPAVVAGLESVGVEVSWGGLLPTPINYFALHEGNFDAAVQITASHNPPVENGLKLIDRHGAVCGDEIREIRKLAECTECRKTRDLGTCTNECRILPFEELYVKKIREVTSLQQPKKIVVDAGNGVAGMFYPEILKKLGHDVVELFCDLNPNFPNHQPDPERPENLEDLIKKVQEEDADFGFAYDGDGDRLGIVLSDGQILSADKILFVLAADFLSRSPGATIVLDAMSSATLAEKIREAGGKPILSKTGHSHIEQKMHETSSLLGGEQSGHFMFGENFYGHDDALLAGLRFLGAIEHNPKLLTEIAEHWPHFFEFNEKIDAPDEKKFKILENFSTEILRKYPDANTLDGIRIDFKKGEWAIVRCSNTSAKIAVRIEALTQENLTEKKAFLIETLEKILKHS